MTRQAARAVRNDTPSPSAGNYSTLALSFARHLRDYALVLDQEERLPGA